MLPLQRSATRGTAFAMLLALMACRTASMDPSTPVATPVAEGHPVPQGIHWVRTAAEHRAVFEQTYRWATDAVRASVSREGFSGPWGVILDADETVLDNSVYQLRRAREGLAYTPESWNAWVGEEAAPALPGSVAFIREVRRMGGRVAIVTNRDDSVCEPTRRNLTAVGVEADVVLCRTPDASDKEGRFRAIQEGTASAGLPPLQVVAWVGDNIRDFPGGSQALRGAGPRALEDFGVRFFALPNPMYGSWESNPRDLERRGYP